MVYTMANAVRFLRDLPISNKEMDDADVLLIAQPDATTPSKFRTVNTNLLSVFTLVKDSIIADGVHKLIHVEEGGGLVGDGTSSNPIQLDRDSLVETIVPTESMNISQIGSMKVAKLPIDSSGFIVKINEDIRCFFNGVTTKIAIQDYDLSTVIGNLIMKTVYLYTVSAGTDIELMAYDTPQAEATDITLIAVLTTDSTKINSIDATPFMRIDKYRISPTMKGSSIPVSAGFAFDTQYTLWE